MTIRILIAGCGQIGTAVGSALVSKGHQVVGLRRSSIMKSDNGICYFQADLTRPETLRNMPVDFDLILIVVTPGERNETGYKAIYLDGVDHLLTRFATLKIKIPIIYVSSTRVYGQQRGEWIDENSVTEPVDTYGRILLAAEQRVLIFGIEHDTTSTIVRFSGIYDRDSLFMQKQAMQGKPIQYSPPIFTNRVHRDDCVGSLLFLIQKLLAGERLATHYLVSDNDPAPKWDVVAWLAKQVGLAEPARENSDITTGQGKRCDNQRICKAGYVFKYQSYRDGYKR